MIQWTVFTSILDEPDNCHEWFKIMQKPALFSYNAFVLFLLKLFES